MRSTVVFLGLLVLLAGCISGTTPTATETPIETRTPTETPNRTLADYGYVVSCDIVESPPEDANVTAYNSSLLVGDTRVKRLLNETYDTESVWQDIDEEAFDALRTELSDLPRFDGDAFGYYIQYRGTIIRIRLIQNV